MDSTFPSFDQPIPKKFKRAPVIVVGILLWLVILVFSLQYFKILDFRWFLLPWRPVGVQPTPPPSGPKVLEDQNYPQLPLPLYHSIVKGASVYYRLVGTVSSLIPQGEDLGIMVAGEDGTVYPAPFVLSAKQTVVTEKGKGFAGFSLPDIKAGDNIELIYTVDLRSSQSLVTQAQVERGE